MRALFALLLVLIPAAVGCRATKDFGRPLPEGSPALLPLDPGEAVPDLRGDFAQRDSALAALTRSLTWMRRPVAKRFFPIEGIEHDRALATLVRLEQVLRTAPDAQSFQTTLEQDFEWKKSAGWDGLGGGVLFTGYYTPIFDGRLERDPVFRYPLYGRPDDLVVERDGKVLGMKTPAGTIPYPTRRNLEENRLLEGRGLEVAWLKDPFEAYLCHVQGSAYLRLADNSLFKLGFGGTNGRDYTSLAKVLVADGKASVETADLPGLKAWAERNPDELQAYLWRNERFIFFAPISGTPHGSLDFPVETERSLATDKTLFPRGGPVVVDTRLPDAFGRRVSPFRSMLFDQDTGGGIRTAGRGDIYLGVGDQAGERAGKTRAEGQLYYFFVREDLVPGLLAAP